MQRMIPLLCFTLLQVVVNLLYIQWKWSNENRLEVGMITGVGFDLETASASDIWRYGPGYVRLCGYINGEPVITEDLKELSVALKEAPWIYAHNFFCFDGLALCYYHPELFNWEELSAKALDTLILSRLDWPPEARSTGGSDDKYDLTSCCERKGVPGKTDDLGNLAKEFGGYDKIPVDDERFQAYLRGDLNAIKGLIEKLPRTPYAKREHKVASINGRMTLNGFRVDEALLAERIEQGESLKGQCYQILM